MTAVEWLIEQIESCKITMYNDGDRKKLISLVEGNLIEQAKEMEKQQIIKNINNYNIKVTEFLLNPLFNLEHSKHGIACEKLSDIRNQFINDNIVDTNEMVSSQTEISDEEIEKAAAHHEPMVTRRAWVSACKWYREQLKQRQ